MTFFFKIALQVSLIMSAGERQERKSYFNYKESV